MDVETLNKAIVGRWFTSFWGQRPDLTVIEELAAPDVLLQYSTHNPRRGRAALKQFMLDFRAAFPDLEFSTVGQLIADRDVVVVRWVGSGTHTGPAFEDFNIGPFPATSGRCITLCGHTAIRLEHSFVAEEAVWATERKMQIRPLTAGLILGLSSEPLLASQVDG
jgi:predicted ester cyclase